jgi:predicted 3-demethylubiquinone-9 3-methyltransferase (glyoxalase superfamily)
MQKITPFLWVDGGPRFPHTAEFSFVRCETQEEVDRTWEKQLAGGGREEPRGWLRDRFGLSWQVIPDALGRYLSDRDPQRVQRVGRRRCR